MTQDPSRPTTSSASAAGSSAPADSRWPLVAIVGRPNVGKSTLLNRIVGHQVAIVEEKPGVTRDRKTVEAEWLGVPFLLMDTGGWMPGGSSLDQKVSKQAEKAVTEADVVLFIVDASIGVTDDDASVADWLRRCGKPVLLVANKADNDRREQQMWELMALGVGEPHPVSALHGRRTGDLLDEVVARFPADHVERYTTAADAAHARRDEAESAADTAGKADVPGIAIVGRPNVGKSTLFNRLIGEDRSVVHDMPGTTRDAVDTVVDTPDGPLRFIDTAGMRRRSRIDEGTEYYSLVRALRAVDEADIALLVIDATEGITSQDQRLAERVDAAGCPILLVLNKWELLDADQRQHITDLVAQRLHFLGEAPVLKISALTGKGVHKLLPLLNDAIELYHKRVSTRDVNKVMARAQQQQPAPGGARVLYALQGATDPPTFTLFVNKDLPPSYLRFLERMIREEFEFGAVPIKMRVRRRGS